MFLGLLFIGLHSTIQQIEVALNLGNKRLKVRFAEISGQLCLLLVPFSLDGSFDLRDERPPIDTKEAEFLMFSQESSKLQGARITQTIL